MLKARSDFKPAVINSDILIVGGYKNLYSTRSSYSVKVFKNNRKSWFYKTDLCDER